MTISKMSLEVKKSWKQIAKIAVLSVLAILFLIYVIRVVTFENTYYSEKEGSERAVTDVAVDTEELVEVQPTEEEVKEYIVAADMPRYLTIGKLGVTKARIIPVGINANNELGTPNNIFDVGWYDLSAKPGQNGTVLIDGHNGGPNVHGVFKDLPVLASGDIIEIERGDGVVFKYSVVENNSVLLSEANAYMSTALKSPVAGKQSVTLISCTGEWSQVQYTYLSRQFTRAVIVEE
ncbi:class F sortase [Candidatus Saccharibacteria bacterium]|nr:class F sortase [Candidatus Saccharibacteria bacterium]